MSESQVCRDCGGSFPFSVDADRCPGCVAEQMGADGVAFTPDEDDAFIDGSRDRYDVSFAGKHVGTRGDMDAAVLLVVVEMQRFSFWPNVWFVNDHGNTTLLSVDADSGAWEFTDTAYV